MKALKRDTRLRLDNNPQGFLFKKIAQAIKTHKRRRNRLR